MVNYKSFKLPGDSRLRVRADRIVATVSSKKANNITVYVDGVPNPLYIPFEGAPNKLMDYIWERSNIEEKEGDE